MPITGSLQPAGEPAQPKELSAQDLSGAKLEMMFRTGILRCHVLSRFWDTALARAHS